ncbi:hypothetical protein BWI92_08955 [Flectobacillus sp. BAB-3569]|nr:hypothetical protein BWI92_08955 [Flectobacillus sp. BAB-3569]
MPATHGVAGSSPVQTAKAQKEISELFLFYFLLNIFNYKHLYSTYFIFILLFFFFKLDFNNFNLHNTVKITFYSCTSSR